MKVLITGGTGTVGKAVVKQNDNEYINVSRNEEKIAELKYIENQIKSLKSDISGAKVTTIPKTTNIESLGKAKPNSPTVIVIPMKETKVKTVTVNGGSGGAVLTGSVSSPQPSKIRNSVI